MRHMKDISVYVTLIYIFYQWIDLSPIRGCLLSRIQFAHMQTGWRCAEHIIRKVLVGAGVLEARKIKVFRCCGEYALSIMQA